jgi:hypothetical protein
METPLIQHVEKLARGETYEELQVFGTDRMMQRDDQVVIYLILKFRTKIGDIKNLKSVRKVAYYQQL